MFEDVRERAKPQQNSLITLDLIAPVRPKSLPAGRFVDFFIGIMIYTRTRFQHMAEGVSVMRLNNPAPASASAYQWLLLNESDHSRPESKLTLGAISILMHRSKRHSYSIALSVAMRRV